MKIKFRHIVTGKIIVTALIFPFLAAAHEPTKDFSDTPHKVWETGLQFMSGVNPFKPMPSQFVAIWLSGDLLIVNAAEEGKTKDINVANAERSMLLNLQNGRVQRLLPSGWILWCFNSSRRIGAIRPSPFHPTLPYKRGQDDYQYELVNISSDGSVARVSNESEKINPTTCLPDHKYPDDFVIRRLREGHGAIVFYKNKTGIEKGMVSAYFPDNGRGPINLGIKPDEVIFFKEHYLEYLSKYQLNYFSYRKNSESLEGEKSGEMKSTPFRLMSINGEIEEIEYPAAWKNINGGDIDYYAPTPAGGVLISESSIFIIMNNNVKRIWDGGSPRFFDKKKNIWGWRVSSDGCNLAFFYGSEWSPSSFKPISVISLCEEKE